MTTATSFYTTTRPSRSGGHAHVMTFETASRSILDTDHPCSCAAGAEGRFCWAVLEAIIDQAPGSDSAELAAAELERRRAKTDKRGQRS